MITVVVPVYNTGKWLPRAIDSLLIQTYNDYEIFIIDDGSTDGSSEICDQQGKKSDRIKVYHKANGGLSTVRNFGIDHAKGDYIIFPDSDDWVEPNYLEKLYNDMNQSGADLAICGYWRSNIKKDKHYQKKIEQMVLNRNEAITLLVKAVGFQGYAWNKLYNLKTIRENNLRFDEELKAVQDLHFAVRYFSFCNKVFFDTTPLYHYSTDTGGVTTFKNFGQRELSGIRTYEKILEVLKGKYPDAEKEVHTSLSTWLLMLMQCYFVNNVQEPKTLRMIKRKFRKHVFYYIRSGRYSKRKRYGSSIAAISPRLYYKLLCKYGHLTVYRKK